MAIKAPGLKVRRRADGVAYYWVAKSSSPKAKEYKHKTVRLEGTPEEIEARCRGLQAEFREWLSGNGVDGKRGYDGTLKSVIRLYQQTPESPYHEIRSNTRAMYDESLGLLEKTVGARRLEKLTGLDFKRWYANFKQPAEDTEKQAERRAKLAEQGIILPPNGERVRRAYKAMQLLRIVIGFGVVLNITECFRLSAILKQIEFTSPKARTAAITFEQAQAVCNKAIEKGLLSIALAQALQFELTLRQIDVIGRWEKVTDAKAGGIVDRGQRWRDGLLWSDIDENGILIKTTSKVDDVVAEHDTMAYPFLRQIIDMVPPEKRVGPMIKCESTGMPYRYRFFSKKWREIANEAGVPADVWNRDSRAGGVTEGSDAGADLEHLRHHANHKNAQTTQRYNRKTLEKTQKVAELRVAHRGQKNVPAT
ncbi:phage integrase [Sinorhizobium sojae CCBAU 05684]|uniref:Phage integrase n=1 Tax=Sinorhizobium sojae CCBAU 05684 TaxID=716928 RepID=A0A249PF46_9HYPH|nr:integrase [Sinorhizobium sojae]ASY64436.1 phage integrase [Sinorhizobium sojae CCBAU 05684]